MTDRTPYAAQRYEYAVLHGETMNEVARYDTLEDAQEAADWAGSFAKCVVRQVKAGSGEVCLGVSDDA